MPKFRIYAPLTAYEKAGDANPMRIGGMVSTEGLDLEDEKLVQEGLDFKPFLTRGWFNDNHGKSQLDILGWPTKAMLVQKGQPLPDGTLATARGWWAEGHLLNTEKGRQTWELAQALSKTPRKLGFSIEGDVKERDRRNPKRVTRGVVKHVAVTHIPVNTDTTLTAFAKALTAGHGILSTDLNQGPGDGGALRAEDLDGKKKPEDDANAVPEMTVESNPANGSLHKSDGVKGDIEEGDLLNEWGEAINRAVRAHPAPATLSKSEARIITRALLPFPSRTRVDAIVGHASTRSPR